MQLTSVNHCMLEYKSNRMTQLGRTTSRRGLAGLSGRVQARPADTGARDYSSPNQLLWTLYLPTPLDLAP